MTNCEKKNDFQNWREDWCEEWREDWYDVDSCEKKISYKDHQVNFKADFHDYTDELESILSPQIPVVECNQVHYDGCNAFIDVVISMD